MNQMIDLLHRVHDLKFKKPLQFKLEDLESFELA